MVLLVEGPGRRLPSRMGTTSTRSHLVRSRCTRAERRPAAPCRRRRCGTCCSEKRTRPDAWRKHGFDLLATCKEAPRMCMCICPNKVVMRPHVYLRKCVCARACVRSCACMCVRACVCVRVRARAPVPVCACLFVVQMFFLNPNDRKFVCRSLRCTHKLNQRQAFSSQPLVPQEARRF